MPSLRQCRADVELRDLISRLEERIQERTAELIRTNRELEQYAWSVAHELRSPLRAVSIFLSIFREENDGKFDDRGRDLLDRMSRGCTRMGELIESLLNLSRVTRSELRRVPVDVSALANLAVQGHREVDPGRMVDVRIEDGLVDQADPALVAIVLRNLIGNAWKFTGKAASPRIEFGRSPAAEGSSYFVRDNGAGFDAAAASSLFTPFERFHSQDDFEGSGIGLALVERIVLRHGGKIRVDAETGKGATFYFTLAPGAGSASS